MNFSESSFNECLFFLFFRTGSARLGGLMAIPKCSKQQDLFYYLQFAPLKKKKVGMQEWICPIKLTQLQRHCCLPLSLLTSARAVGFISTMVPNVTPIFEESGLLVFLINHCNYLARHHQEEPWIVTRLHLSCVQKKTMNICWESFKGGADLSLEHPPAIKWFANAFIISILCALTFDEE